MILFVPNVHQKYLKQVTFDNELTLAFLSVMGHKQRMMTVHLTANRMKIVLNSFGLTWNSTWLLCPLRCRTHAGLKLKTFLVWRVYIILYISRLSSLLAVLFRCCYCCLPLLFCSLQWEHTEQLSSSTFSSNICHRNLDDVTLSLNVVNKCCGTVCCFEWLRKWLHRSQILVECVNGLWLSVSMQILFSVVFTFFGSFTSVTVCPVTTHSTEFIHIVVVAFQSMNTHCVLYPAFYFCKGLSTKQLK